MRTILLGPQRFTIRATAALRSLETHGPVAVVNPGWEEREDATGELDAALDHRSVHLRLFHRFTDVLEKDSRFAAAGLRLRDRHDELTSLYRLRLEHTLDGVYAVHRRLPHHPARARHSQAARALRDCVDEIRGIDEWYLDRLRKLHGEFADESGMATSGVIGWHREELRAMLDSCAVLVLPGGNVGSLLRALRLFSVRIPDRMPVIAWSAGAMVLTDRIVLFHDFGPEGARESELLDRGLGRIPEIVAFPHARRRLRLDDRGRCSVLAMRFGDERCLLLDDGSWIEIGADGLLPPGARVLGTDGLVATVGSR
ncbi:MAG: hypothetical protein IPH03_00585 [Tetrasphaera sp.]|nr:hypothetical protein [Tetrasphaera sp.]